MQSPRAVLEDRLKIIEQCIQSNQEKIKDKETEITALRAASENLLSWRDSYKQALGALENA